MPFHNGAKLITNKVLWLALFLISTSVQANDDTDSYCAYVNKKAEAEKIILNYPDAIVRFSKEEYGNIPIILLGMQQNIVNYFRSGILDDIAEAECNLYLTSQAASNELKYALMKIERETMIHRVELLGEIIQNVSSIIESSNRKLKQGSTSMGNHSIIEEKRNNLIKEKITIEEALATMQLPESVEQQPMMSIQAMIYAKEKAEKHIEESKNRLEKQRDWDILIQAGMGQNLETERSDPFIALNLRYSFGGMSRRHQIDEAEHLYSKWKTNQQSETSVSVALIKKQIEKMIIVETDNITTLTQLLNTISSKITILSMSDSYEAFHMKTVADIERMILLVSLKAARFKISKLNAYGGE